MEQKTLINQLMSKFAIYMAILLVISAPVFYMIVTNFYMEDLREAAAMAGIPIERFDLEEDTVIGLAIQVFAVVVILGINIFLIMRLIPTKLWKPFYDTLGKLGTFRVEDGRVPTFKPSSTKEFAILNDTLHRILSENVRSFQVQKQFTENASHELQTPLAIIQGKLDLLLQSPDLTERQAGLMQDIYHEVNHMSLLNRNLLLLARIENSQYRTANQVNVAQKVSDILPYLEPLTGDIDLKTHITDNKQEIPCNEVLLESMIYNLVVNAVRHNRQGGHITLTVDDYHLTVANTSDEGPLDAGHIFERFFRNGKSQRGNGLGLAIVKSICEYHQWTVRYEYCSGEHHFLVDFHHAAKASHE